MSTPSNASADSDSISPQQREYITSGAFKSSFQSKPDWLETSLTTARGKGKRNRDDLKELCETIMEIIRIIEDQLSSHGDIAAVKIKGLCEDFEGGLERASDRLTVDLARVKEIIKLDSTADEITKYRTKIQELRLNFLVMTAIDTNLQVHKALSIGTPTRVPQAMNNCPPPTRIFRGRQTIIDKMYQYFTRNRGTLSIFLLQGLGGAGKTQIALKFIQEARPHSTVTTIETGLKDLAMTKSVGDSSEAALQWLKVNQDEWLLLFDNADDPKINLNNYFPRTTVQSWEHYAVDLLLRSAAQDTNVRNKETAALIVKAGAFISKSGNLNSYLAIYVHNKARLLTERPAQAQDNYPWTVYTTWQISFDQLSDQAKTFLKLCSYLHYQGISEDIFRNATTYQVESAGPELDMPLKILSQFLGPSGSWDPLSFMDVTNDLRAYSLINFDSEKCLFSIHPLVHEWIRSTLSDELHHHCMKRIVGMSLTRVSEGDLRHYSLLMLPHIDFLPKGNSHIIPDFGHKYGKVYLFSGKPEKAEELEVVGLEKRRNILGEDHPNTLQAMYWLAWAYEHMAKWDKAEELGRIVLRKRSEILGENHPDTLEALGNLAIVCNKLGKLKESEESGVVLRQKSRNILGDNDPTTLAVMSNMVYTYNTLGRAHEAEKLGVAALEKRRNILGDNHPDTVTIMANFAVTYISLGKLQEAQELALAAFEKRTSHNYPETLRVMGNLAFTYHRLERLQEAEALQVLVIEKRKDILGHNHPDTLSTMGNLAATYNKLGRLQEAMKLEAEVLEMRRKTLGSNHPHTLRTMSNLGSTLNKLGKWKEAEDLLIEALKNQTELLGDNHLQVVDTRRNLAVTYTELSKVKEAEDLNGTLNKGQA
ncbi:hypothetical protein FB451DRAFT_1377465 [Mycena latifolia]|nr:hypothetical protein FB451DRAFT_1377465 [Mycena latifolia]